MWDGTNGKCDGYIPDKRTTTNLKTGNHKKLPLKDLILMNKDAIFHCRVSPGSTIVNYTRAIHSFIVISNGCDDNDAVMIQRSANFVGS
jgi:hypothetical protein